MRRVKDRSFYNEPWFGSYKSIVHKKEIDNAPTLDVEPVRRGKWVWADDGYCRCSECTQKAPVVRQWDDEPITTQTNYCPDCGAKMENGG